MYNLTSPLDTSIDMDRIPPGDEAATDDKYIGYSSVICNMDNDELYNGLEYVFGGPRGELYFGEVLLNV